MLCEILSDYAVIHAEHGNVMAIITVVREYERRDVDERLFRICCDYPEVIRGEFHIHLGKSYSHCLEIIVAEGKVERLRG